MPGPFRFEPPVLGGHIVGRRALQRRLDRRWDHRLTTIIAGPGFGKTTALAQAVATNRRDPKGNDRWLTCEPTDDVVSRLAAGIASSFDLGSPDSAEVPELVADAVSRSSPTHVCLLLDDVHLLERRSPSADLIGEILRLLPANGHLVLSSRVEPPVPVTRLAAQGAVVRIDENDLRFGDEDVAALSTATGIDVKRFGATGGWPAMVALAAFGEDPNRFVWEEVVDGLDVDRRTSLAVLAMLPSADNALIREVTGNASVDLATVTDGVPLVSRSEDGAYQLHALWQTALAAELSSHQRQEVRERAARALVNRDDYETAMALLDPAADWPTTSDVIRAACGKYAAVSIPTLGRWRRAIPDDRSEEPEVLLVDGIIAGHTDPIGSVALPTVVRAAEGFRARNDHHSEAFALAHAAYRAWIQNDIATLLTLLVRARELDELGITRARWSVRFGEAMIAAATGDTTTVLKAVREVQGIADDPNWIAIAHWFEAMWSILIGDTAAARAAAERTTEQSERHFFSGRIQRALCEWILGDPGSTERFLAALDDSAPFGFEHDRPVAEAYRAVVHGFAGAVDAADDAAARARHDIDKLTPFGTTLLAMADAIAAIERHDEDAATEAFRNLAATDPLPVQAETAVRGFLAVAYVLAPSMRSKYDDMELSGRNRQARDVARVVVTLRENDGDRLRSLGWPSYESLRRMIPRPWVALLAVAGRAAGVAAADDLVASLSSADPRWFLSELRWLGQHGSTKVAATAKKLLASLPVPPSAAVTVRALGPTTLERAGTPVDDSAWRRNRVRSLLAFLIVHRRTRRESVAAALWPDLDDESASNNLAVTLNYLNRVLEPGRERGSPPWFVRTDGTHLSLAASDSITVDGWELEADIKAADAAASSSQALPLYERAVSLWNGEWLEEFDDDWALADRDRVRALFVRASVRAGEFRLAGAEPDQAIELAERAAAVEPWSEAAFRLLIAAHIAAGDRAAARRSADRCYKMLAELGVSAEPATEMVMRSLEPASTA